MIATIETRPATTVVALRHIGPYHEIGRAFDQLGRWIQVNSSVTGLMIGIYYDDPRKVPLNELKSDACVIVPENFELGERFGMDLRVIVLPAGEYAKATHMGSYDGLFQAWQDFFGTVPKLNRTIADDGPEFELYINDCSEVPAEQLQTDLYALLEPAN